MCFFYFPTHVLREWNDFQHSRKTYETRFRIGASNNWDQTSLVVSPSHLGNRRRLVSVCFCSRLGARVNPGAWKTSYHGCTKAASERDAAGGVSFPSRCCFASCPRWSAPSVERFPPLPLSVREAVLAGVMPKACLQSSRGENVT